jgi:hypothetical protein
LGASAGIFSESVFGKPSDFAVSSTDFLSVSVLGKPLVGAGFFIEGSVSMISSIFFGLESVFGKESAFPLASAPFPFAQTEKGKTRTQRKEKNTILIMGIEKVVSSGARDHYEGGSD